MKLAELRAKYAQDINTSTYAISFRKKDKTKFSIKEVYAIELLFEKLHNIFDEFILKDPLTEKLITTDKNHLYNINIFFKSNNDEKEIIFDLIESEINIRPIHYNANIYFVEL